LLLGQVRCHSVLIFGVVLGPDFFQREGFTVVQVRSPFINAVKLGNVKKPGSVVPCGGSDVRADLRGVVRAGRMTGIATPFSVISVTD